MMTSVNYSAANTKTDTEGGFTSHSFSYNHPGGTLVAMISRDSGGGAVTCTFNGVSLTSIVALTSTYSRVNILELQDAPAGNYTLAFSWSTASSSSRACGVSLTAGSQVDVSTLQTTTTSGTAASLSIASDTGDIVLGVEGADAGSGAAITPSDTVISSGWLYDDWGGGYHLQGLHYAAGASPTKSISFTKDVSGELAFAAVNVTIPSTGVGGPAWFN